MQDWRSWETGRKTIYEGTEFDGSFHFEGVITEVHEDHLICEAEGMRNPSGNQKEDGSGKGLGRPAFCLYLAHPSHNVHQNRRLSLCTL